METISLYDLPGPYEITQELDIEVPNELRQKLFDKLIELRWWWACNQDAKISREDKRSPQAFEEIRYLYLKPYHPDYGKNIPYLGWDRKRWSDIENKVFMLLTSEPGNTIRGKDTYSYWVSYLIEDTLLYK